MITLLFLDYSVRRENMRQKQFAFETSSFSVIFHNLLKVKNPKKIVEFKALLHHKLRKRLKRHNQVILKLKPKEDSVVEIENLCDIVDITFAMSSYSHVEILKNIATLGNRSVMYKKIIDKNRNVIDPEV